MNRHWIYRSTLSIVGYRKALEAKATDFEAFRPTSRIIGDIQMRCWMVDILDLSAIYQWPLSLLLITRPTQTSQDCEFNPDISQSPEIFLCIYFRVSSALIISYQIRTGLFFIQFQAPDTFCLSSSGKDKRNLGCSTKRLQPRGTPRWI